MFNFNDLKLLTLILTTCFAVLLSTAQEDPWIHPNKGQWESHILYKIELEAGAMFIEKDAFTYVFTNYKGRHDHDGEDHAHQHEDDIKFHGLKSTFVNSSWAGKVEEKDSSDFYRNYIIGSDSSKWQSKLHAYRSVKLIDFYPKIDLLLEAKNEQLKYSFIVHPGGNPDNIVIKHEGEDQLFLDEENNLHHITSIGNLMESKPVSYLLNGDRKRKITSAYTLNGNKTKFDIPDYDPNQTLIIDPFLTFSSFTGSTADNWGFTATPDKNANLIAGGIVVGTGYPISTGAYDGTFNGGEGSILWDVSISKFNSNGTALLYSTYLGGSGNETAHSIVANNAGELFILGVTSSTNFPMAGTPHQNTMNGGTLVQENSIQFSGTDIYIARLNATGTSLLASTYMGGSGNDGLNTGNLLYNYGDQFRGEITLDATGNVYFSSTTQSSNFPTLNASDNSLGGIRDAVVGKFNSTLTNLIWSTYYGGSGDETGNALQVSSTGSVYLTGGTTSTNLNISGGQTSSFIGGMSDGYLVRLNGTNSNVLSGTYLGTNDYDQSFFVQIDMSDKIYVFGQTEGSIPITPGKYGVANSGQFIMRFSENLANKEWQTVVGSGSGTVEISPTAFLVSDCNEIYYTGWGGTLNNQFGQATGSSTNNFPTTTGAYQTTTNGNNFYIGVLGPDGVGLEYATFIGGTTGPNNHVDGGTSRFDKGGRIYHAVCGGCGGNANGFTTTPGVVSTTNQSSNCNLAAFKFDLGSIQSALGAPSPFVCLPNPVTFQNNSTNGNSYFWDFGDGNTSTQVAPSHTYNTPGQYQVMLVVSDSNGCFQDDTAYFDIDAFLFQGAITQPSSSICPSDSIQLEASGGINYNWSPAQFLDDPTSPTPMASVTQNTTFTVIVSDSCGSDTLDVLVEVFDVNTNSAQDTMLCLGQSAELWVSGGVSYTWTPVSGLNVSDQDTVIATPNTTTNYVIDITTSDGCAVEEEIFVEVFDDVPTPVLPDTVPLCRNSSVDITASGGTSYTWTPPTGLNTTTGATVTCSVLNDQLYTVGFTNACGTVYDSVFVDVIVVDAQAGNDTIICPGDTAFVWASGGVSYSWTPSAYTFDAGAPSTFVYPPTARIFTVEVTDINGCIDTAKVLIDHYPTPEVTTNNDQYGFIGDVFDLIATGSSLGGNYQWTPAETVDCPTCATTVARPENSTTYIVLFTDENGCQDDAAINIYFDPIVYVPNTFTPDNDAHNNLFKVEASNVKDFELLIFNRWGELIYKMTDPNDTWDGTYNGVVCKDGTYVWKMTYKSIRGEQTVQTGHINLLK
ncbi:gliding motility-associated C-terminal domain-containing protein [Lishizhenia sp.]|uniref:DUF7948 domain-containing protein n=1 Tax=Lishizhenia sp. TaxID=2497594 RepID=UPI00299DFD71|nr:gliding motility-associated C-terminal domain-containing protein [Lishizhenia sp.]MDX1444982.1 gliding motility-associated C-terminal domain-containing protein [Lishizhenia sp.]